MSTVNPARATSIAPRTGVKEAAERCLRGNPYLALKNLTCEYRNGVLVLGGYLPTYHLKQLAQEAVAHLDGVERVENGIQVTTAACRSLQS